MSEMTTANRDTAEKRSAGDDERCVQPAIQNINFMLHRGMRAADIAFVGALMLEFALANLNCETMKNLFALKDYFTSIRDAITAGKSAIDVKGIHGKAVN
jgi:hypothetical protein